MLTIKVSINGREVAVGTVCNISNLTDVSDYTVVWSEMASEITGMPERANTAKIKGHNRRQSVWALVQKVAAIACNGKDIMGGR